MSLIVRVPVALILIFLLSFLLPTACEDGVGTEICGDGEDNDFDGVIDEGVDEDGDTYRTCDIAELIDCDDSNPDVHPDIPEACDGNDTDCNGVVDDVDLDGDGFISSACGGQDCDDSDQDAFPGRAESCDFADNDCDGTVDEGFDADNDEWTFCQGDCDNTDPFIHPDAEEICDGIDNDCDCSGDSNNDATACGPGDRGVDEDFDLDGDGFVDASNAFCVPVYGVGGVGEAVGDCDDDPTTGPTVHPGAHEDSGDGLDNDCDDCVDECQDADGDGWDTCAVGAPGDPTCVGESLPDDGQAADCNDEPGDLFAPITNPGVEFPLEIQDVGVLTIYDQCDTVDNNCDGCIDEGFAADCSGLLDVEDFVLNGPPAICANPAR